MLWNTEHMGCLTLLGIFSLGFIQSSVAAPDATINYLNQTDDASNPVNVNTLDDTKVVDFKQPEDGELAVGHPTKRNWFAKMRNRVGDRTVKNQRHTRSIRYLFTAVQNTKMKYLAKLLKSRHKYFKCRCTTRMCCLGRYLVCFSTYL